MSDLLTRIEPLSAQAFAAQGVTISLAPPMARAEAAAALPDDARQFPLGVARGQIANTYIVAEAADGLVLVDPGRHAPVPAVVGPRHERVALVAVEKPAPAAARMAATLGSMSATMPVMAAIASARLSRASKVTSLSSCMSLE